MIYVVRHGETNWNVIGRNQGRQDISLNDKGRKQAHDLCGKLENITFDVVISSPLKRAYETAEIIVNKRNQIITDERIIERCNGELEGKVKQDIDPHIDFNNPNGSGYGIENITDFRQRIYDFLEDISSTYVNQNVLVVTHAGVGIYIRCFFEGEPKNNDYTIYKMKNGAILKYDNKKSVKKL